MSKNKNIKLHDQAVSIEVTRVFGEYGDKKVTMQRSGRFDPNVSEKEINETIDKLFTQINLCMKKFKKQYRKINE